MRSDRLNMNVRKCKNDIRQNISMEAPKLLLSSRKHENATDIAHIQMRAHSHLYSDNAVLHGLHLHFGLRLMI